MSDTIEPAAYAAGTGHSHFRMGVAAFSLPAAGVRILPALKRTVAGQGLESDAAALRTGFDVFPVGFAGCPGEQFAGLAFGHFETAHYSGAPS
jgi:hypothetical protein